MSTKVDKTEEQWREELTPEQYQVLRKKGTEAPFTGRYVETKADGAYPVSYTHLTLPTIYSV